MNEAKYQTSLQEVKTLLKRTELCKVTYNKDGNYSKQYFEALKSLNHVESYKIAIDNLDYDILMFDDSIFQFSYRKQNKIIRYGFNPNPFDVPTYEAYLEEIGFNYDEVGELFREDYEQETFEATIKAGLLPLRYDFSIKEYTEGIHPASHMHIGINNSARIPVRYYLTPMIFVLFVIKQIYHDQWKDILRHKYFKEQVERSKAACMKIENDLFSVDDAKELYLT